MLLYLVLERTVTQALQFAPAFSEGYTPDAAIHWLKAIVAHSNGLVQHLHSSEGRLEFASHGQTWQIPMLLKDLERAISQLHPLLAERLQPRLQISTINQISGDQIIMNNPQTRVEVQQNFNASVYGVAGNLEGNQNIFAGNQRQTLAEAAQEIQQLLQQLEKSNPGATESQRSQFVTMAIEPSRRQRFASALNAGWKEAIKELLDNAYLNIAIAILEGWQDPKP